MKFRTNDRFRIRNFIPILALSTFAFFVVENDLAQRIERGLERYIAQSPEKIYLHTDKPYYSAGETIWFKAYLVDAVRHRSGSPSKVIYVEFISSEKEVIAEQILKVTGEGATADIELPVDLPEGNYLLRAYTNHMRNWENSYFFEKALPVFNINGPEERGVLMDEILPGRDSSRMRSVIVRFYPEGGDLIAGLQSKVGVKAVDKDGRGVRLQGRIVDLGGREITRFKTGKRGFGLLSLTPKKAQLYTALFEYQGRNYRFQLPAPAADGYTLSSTTLNAEGELHVSIKASEKRKVSNMALIAHVRGVPVTTIEIPDAARRSFTTTLPLDSFPGGVAHLTLLTKSGLPVAERLVFVRHPEREAQLRIDLSQKRYHSREKVDVELSVSDVKGRGLPAKLSASVTDAASVEQHPHAENIYTYLLLNADLPGHIEQPGYFFEEPDNFERLAELDLLLMTQGWRRFRWKDLLRDTTPSLEYRAEKALSLEGKVTNVYGKPVGTCLVWITAHQEDPIFSKKLRTDERGHFFLPDLNFTGPANFLLQARKPRKRILKKEKIPGEPVGSANVGITFGAPKRPSITDDFRRKKLPPVHIVENFLHKNLRIRQVERAFDGMRIFLNEVEISAAALEPVHFNHLRNPYLLKEAPDSLLRQIAPVSAPDLLHNTGPFDQILLRPTPEPVFTWNGRQVQFQDDGITLDLGGGSRNNLRFTKLRNIIRPSNSSISTLYSGLNTGKAWYSPEKIDGENQVFVSYGLLDYTHPGYYQAREFYAPTYDQPLPSEQRPDVRTTIHWEPDLETDTEGKAEISFYTADNTGAYDIIVQGITKDGRPVTGRQTVVVK